MSSLSSSSRDVFNPDGSRPQRSPSLWRWLRPRVPPPASPHSPWTSSSPPDDSGSAKEEGGPSANSSRGTAHRQVPTPSPSAREVPRHPRCRSRFLLPSSPHPTAAAIIAPLEEEGLGHAPREVQPRDIPSYHCGGQVEVDHHGNCAVVIVVVTAAAVVTTAGRRGCRPHFHRSLDDFVHFLPCAD